MFLYNRYCTVFMIVVICLITATDYGYSRSRWFRFSPGIRAGMIGAGFFLRDSVSENENLANLDFWVGANFNFTFHRRLGMDIDIIYTRKGALLEGRVLHLHYITIPSLFKLWVTPKIFAINIGLSQSFLIFPEGQLKFPEVQLTRKNVQPYQLAIVAGITYAFKEFKNDIRIVGDIGVEFGITDIFKPFKPKIYTLVMPYLTIGINF